MKKVITMTILALGVMFTNILIAQGFDNVLTEDIDEGAIGTGFDNVLTEDIDEGNWWDSDN